MVVGSGSLAAAVADCMLSSGWQVAPEAGPCSAWVNCCTLPMPGDSKLAPDAWATAVASRTQQLAELCEQARAAFTDGGAIVNVLGVEALFAAPQRGARSASESAAAMLTKTLGVAWAAQGIRVNGVAILTGYQARAPRHPAGRLPTEREIAEAVAFLAGPDAAYITAEILRVDCGWGAYQLF